MTRIKICGITNKADAVAAADLGVDMLGFIFYPKSPRYVDPATAEDIVNALPDDVVKVGVFVDEKEKRVVQIAQDVQLDTLQFHGAETPEYCASFKEGYRVIKAFRLRDKSDLVAVNGYDVDYYLLDTYEIGSCGGTGKVFDWKMLKDFEFLKPVILSGGLNSSNVGKAIAEVAPYGVDVASGVEKSPGKKDIELMRKFVAEVRKA
ncbi:MAG: phosphoribosylanthranilate isomerase [Candidatus Omnitrophica bacterium]|nr:phosphoribosylanthranilate isomerase [Candidatus Omnitrophota bacterium]MCM8790824.1 phosphoribosylanthranilate isomerase [Candidatus Omnitrophota bacterium]